MVTHINKMFLYPIEIKFEKIYKESILCAKKRYVGHKVEEYRGKPIIDCKGIEIVRRDGCSLTSKIMLNCISKLF